MIFTDGEGDIIESRTTDTQRELFLKNSKLLGLGRQIGLKFVKAFEAFLAKLGSNRSPDCTK